jgi:MFS family permease
MLMQKILNRDFVLGFFAQFTFSSVFFILVPTIPIYLSRMKSEESEIGILVGILSITSLVLRPFVGRGLLRIPERNFMITGALLYAGSSIFYLFAPPFWPFLIVRVFQGVGFAFFSTASFTFIANISPEAHWGQIISYFYLSINIAFTLAPYFGMILINVFDFTVLFLICAGLSLCSLFITSKLKNRTILIEKLSAQEQTFLSRGALSPAIMALLVNINYGALIAFFPLYAINHGVANPGLFFGAFAFILVIGRAFGGKILDIYSREKVIPPCIILHIISNTVLSFSTTLPMFVLVAVIWGMGSALLYPLLVASALDRGGSSRGPAMGTFTALADLGVGMGPVIMGFILQLTNYPIMFLCLAVTSSINLLYFFYAMRKK